MATRTARVQMRLSGEQKRLLEQAAAIRGQDFTSFALGALLKEADDVVAKHHVTTLSQRDFREFVKLLEHPPRPNAALKAAFRRLKDVRQ